MRTVVIGCLLALAAASGVTAELAVHVHADVGAEPALVAHVEAQTTDGSVSRIVEVPVNGAATLDVDPGAVWEVSAAADGLWARPETLFVPETGASVTLRLLRTGELRGTLVGSGTEPSPSTVKVRFSSSGTARTTEGSVACPVTRGAFSCAIPEGTWDLRLRVQSFVSWFVWGASVQPGTSLDLGKLTLRRGASVVGVVKALDGPGLDRSCKVRLLAQHGALDQQDISRHEKSALEVSPDARGFFHFEGVQPGRYLLSAEQRGYAEARVFPVDVVESSETALVHDVELMKPLTFDLSLEPPEDPYGEPWEVTLVDEGGDRAIRSVVVSGDRAVGGLWSREGMRPGRYTLRVFDSQNSMWAAKELELQPADRYLSVEIPMVDVEGEVSLGGEPIAAEISLSPAEGRRDLAPSVTLTSGSDGVVRGVLPFEGVYEALVRAVDPHLSKWVSAVEVSKLDGAPVARFSVALAGSAVKGVVVDEREQPVADAEIRVYNRDVMRDLTSARSNDEGEFVVLALEEGEYTVFAQQGERRSREALLSLGDTEPAPLKLVLESQSDLKGRVVDSSGNGVAGAAIMVGGASFTAGGQATAGLDGRFSLPVPGESLDLMFLVHAPGYAFHGERRHVARGDEILLRLSQIGSGITLSNLEAAHESGKLAVLLRGGAILAEGILRMWATTNGVQTADPDQLLVPMMEPGPYQVCAAPISVLHAVLSGAGQPQLRCSDTYLQPGVEVAVAVPP